MENNVNVYPFPTAVALRLGTGFLHEVVLYVETLELSVSMLYTLIYATHASILKSDISNFIYIKSSPSTERLPTAFFRKKKNTRGFGKSLKPLTFSAQKSLNLKNSRPVIYYDFLTG